MGWFKCRFGVEWYVARCCERIATNHGQEKDTVTAPYRQ